MHQPCQCLFFPATSSIFGSPNGSGADLDGVCHRSHDAHFKEFRDMLGPLVRDLPILKIISGPSVTNVEQIVSAFCAKMGSFTEMEQNVSCFTQNASSLTARMCKIETKCSLCFKRFWLGKVAAPHLDRLVAPQRQGPMTQGLLKKTGTQDADPILSSYGFLANNAMQVCPLG